MELEFISRKGAEALSFISKFNDSAKAFFHTLFNLQLKLEATQKNFATSRLYEIIL